MTEWTVGVRMAFFVLGDRYAQAKRRRRMRARGLPDHCLRRLGVGQMTVKCDGTNVSGSICAHLGRCHADGRRAC